MTTVRRSLGTEKQTALTVAIIGVLCVLLLCLQLLGLFPISLQSNAIYNPLPSYGPLRSVRSESATSERAAASSSWSSVRSSSSARRSSSSSSLNAADARRLRILERERTRSL